MIAWPTRSNTLDINVNIGTWSYTKIPINAKMLKIITETETCEAALSSSFSPEMSSPEDVSLPEKAIQVMDEFANVPFRPSVSVVERITTARSANLSKAWMASGLLGSAPLLANAQKTPSICELLSTVVLVSKLPLSADILLQI
jgi:hypothetical protein